MKANIYKRVIYDEYKTGIYDANLSVFYNHGADKYRVEYGYTKWCGNTGGYAVRKYFLAGKDGRRMIKEYALAQHQTQHNFYAPRDIFIV